MRLERGRKYAIRRVLAVMQSRKPDFMVGEASDPYLRRWRLTPKWLMKVCAVYAHEFCKSDDDVPHDHPYLVNASWVLQIGYFEHQFARHAIRNQRYLGEFFIPDYKHDLERKWVAEGGLVWRWGWTAHRIELRQWRAMRMTGRSVAVLPAPTSEDSAYELRTPHPITLFFCGPRVREWGFHCPQGWRPWREYIAPTSYGNRVGKGCGE